MTRMPARYTHFSSGMTFWNSDAVEEVAFPILSDVFRFATSSTILLLAGVVAVDFSGLVAGRVGETEVVA